MAVKLTAVVAYLLILLGIGVVASRRVKDVRDYFAAGKKLGFFVASFSARATGESAWLLLGLTGMGAAVGAKAFWVVFGETLGVALAWWWMCGRFKRLSDRYDAITVPDYLAGRFRDSTHAIRKVAAGALVVFVTIYVSAQIDATGTAFESFLGWNYFVGALVGFAVVMVYIVAGGFLAVAWSDAFQGTLMLIGLVVLPLVGLGAVGGFDGMVDKLTAIDPSLLTATGAGGWSAINICGILSLALIGLGFLGSPQIFVRFIALRSTDEIRKGAWVAVIWTILADGGAVLTGMIGRALLTEPGTGIDGLGNGAQDVLPMLVESVFPLLIVGIYVAVVLSAIMSTIDSLLVVGGSAAVRDYYQQVENPEMPDEALVSKSRTATFILAIIALAIAMFIAVAVPERTVFWFVIFGWSGISATFCPTIILSLFWAGMTRRGALGAMIGGFLAVPFFKFAAPSIPKVGPYFEALGELPSAFAVSFLLGVLLSITDAAGRERMRGIAEELRARE